MRGFRVAGVRGASSLRAEVCGDGGRQQGRRPPWPLSQGLECLAEELDLFLGSQPVLHAAPRSRGETPCSHGHCGSSASLVPFPWFLSLAADLLGREDFMVSPPPTHLARIHNLWRSLVGADESL